MTIFSALVLIFLIVSLFVPYCEVSGGYHSYSVSLTSSTVEVYNEEYDSSEDPLGCSSESADDYYDDDYEYTSGHCSKTQVATSGIIIGSVFSIAMVFLGVVFIRSSDQVSVIRYRVGLIICVFQMIGSSMAANGLQSAASSYLKCDSEPAVGLGITSAVFSGIFVMGPMLARVCLS